MRSTIIGALMASALALPALAQSAPDTATRPAPAAPSATIAPAPITSASMWRSSKLIGLNVYNEQNEKLGDINEILVDKSGKIDGVVIGVGGFLGMGERNIKVDMAKLKFVDEPVKTSTTSTTSTTATSGNASRPATTTTTTSRKWYPDHAVLAGASKDQLKTMTEFKYD
jgi:sporulation protein YlmC with PRC-barrel domain